MHSPSNPALAPTGLSLSASRRSEHPEPEPVCWQHEADEVVDGKYKLVRPLGRGGMAEVWLAVHVNLRNELAIKFLHAGLIADPDHSRMVLERFRFEAQISARLGARTRGIVAVQDAGIYDGVPYLVMEYIPGRTLLTEVTETGPMDPARFADLLDQIASALSVAHEMGIVHRDLKPSNLILVDGPGGSPTVMLTDFGIAKAMRGDLGLDRPKQTEAGTMLGSPNYMSPEQIEAPLRVGVRTDIWALGVMAYEALTDWPPFHGRSVAQLIIAISTSDFEPPSKLRPGLPRALDDWFARALAKDPDQRFASVVEMAAAFRAALTAPVAATRTRPTVTTATLAAVVAGVVTLAVPAAAAWYALRDPRATQWMSSLWRPAPDPSAAASPAGGDASSARAPASSAPSDTASPPAPP